MRLWRLAAAFALLAFLLGCTSSPPPQPTLPPPVAQEAVEPLLAPLPSPEARQDDSAELEALRQDLEATQRELAGLKRSLTQEAAKNDQLANELAETKQKVQAPGPSTISVPPPAGVSSLAPSMGYEPQPSPQPAATKTHWMTYSSSKRHNRYCRWFMNSNGRPCLPSEGIACKVCGG
jgi:hypothetical protein